jgi:twitching motility protein PilT
MLMEKILKYTKAYSLSDLHIHSDRPFSIRENGEIKQFDDFIVKKKMIEEFLNNYIGKNDVLNLVKTKELDTAIQVDGIRYRVNAYYANNGVNLVLRLINSDVIPMEVLGLPPVIEEQIQVPSGLILVTGPTGSGKSTTLASMIDWLNKTRTDNIITIEDPIEFIHHSKKSIVSQRQVGKDTKSFNSALKAALREDPDILLVGELRDSETISLALTAAETGHLVFGTLHTNGASQTINRIVDSFSSDQQNQVRLQLSQTLRMVVTQRLHKRIDKKGRLATFEILIMNHAIANLIRESKIEQINSQLQINAKVGMVTMDKSINIAIKEGKIDPGTIL